MRSEIHRLPELFLKRLRQIVPSSKWDAIANTFAEAKPATFRVNTLKTTSSEVKRTLEEKNFWLAAIPWFGDAFLLRKGRQKELEETEIYQEGHIYLQSLSSMIPPLILEPKPGESILDLTAAPGGKTAQMACLMKNEGRIVANESNKVRYEKLKSNLKTQGAQNAEAVLSYGESFGNKFPETFDRVLVDAPCSAEGRFLASEPPTYRYWNLDVVKENAKLQKKLLISGLKALKLGGVLVYSTCTFAPEENEEVVDSALQSMSGLIELETIQWSVPNQNSGLVKWQGRALDSSLRKTLRILPTPEMEGFYAARIRKKKTAEIRNCLAL